MALAACLLVVPLAQAQSASSRVDRLTELVVQTVPMGKVFDMLAADDPAWPMQEKPDAVGPGQLACLRDELSPSGYQRMKRTEVVAYVAENPGQVEADIAVLEAGGARLMGVMMMAGVEQERTGVPADEQKIMSEAGPGELEAFMQMMAGPDQAPLRGLLGIGNAFGAELSAEENESAGEQAGGDLATRVMLKAMSNCSVSTEVLFN
jgi:hypothetical protein